MKKDVLTVLWHCCDTCHQFCPTTNSSWCKWQRDRITGECNYKNNLNLPVDIKNLLHPIFIELSSDNLLSKILINFTHNLNESFNQIIWENYQKTHFVSKSILELAVFSAVIA